MEAKIRVLFLNSRDHSPPTGENETCNEGGFQCIEFHESLPTSSSLSSPSAAVAPALGDFSVGLVSIGSATLGRESAFLRLFSSDCEDMEEVLRRLRGPGA